MKKRYTKKQICEAIAYWKKQLRAGNYKKINESNSIYSRDDIQPLIDYWSYLWNEEFDYWCDPEDEDSNEVIAHNEIEDELVQAGDLISPALVKKIVSNCENMADDIVHYSYGDVKMSDLNLNKLAPFKKM